MNYNRIILIGRLTRDPEYKVTPSGVPVASFTLAIDRPQSAEARQQGAPKETDFIDISVWRQQADIAANLLAKGKLILVEGALRIRTYQAQDGQNRKATEVLADTFRLLEKRSDSDGMGEDMGGGGGGGGYDRAPAGGRGGYSQGGNQGSNQGGNQGGRGGYDRGGNAGGNASGNRGGRAPQPPAEDLGNDFDDPFASE